MLQLQVIKLRYNQDAQFRKLGQNKGTEDKKESYYIGKIRMPIGFYGKELILTSTYEDLDSLRILFFRHQKLKQNYICRYRLIITPNSEQ